MSTTPTTTSFKFYVLPEDGPQRLHDAFQDINRLAFSAQTALTDDSRPDALVEIIRLSELHRRQLHALLTHGPITMTTTATTEA